VLHHLTISFQKIIKPLMGKKTGRMRQIRPSEAVFERILAYISRTSRKKAGTYRKNPSFFEGFSCRKTRKIFFLTKENLENDGKKSLKTIAPQRF
jgi:hypothetical protein